MNTVLVAAVVLAVLHASSAQGKKCGEGEVYKEGQSSTCGEHRCGDPEDGIKSCTFDLVSRCFCQDNLYRRSSDGKCVPKEEC
ncbi:chymotrypsin-elastase inhibitor ixodidin [Rhipicephalus sanguineus]|uniref:chymotrypsin-elastase inhibitor ixodidin n=1 Tax=Rhipicephalus sanguineus TaxID=34632 RepID=UPI0018945CD1|nr:chymotrypsin-elastase inhibitor ixodidin [Rhipicephalus sanguineus]